MMTWVWAQKTPEQKDLDSVFVSGQNDLLQTGSRMKDQDQDPGSAASGARRAGPLSSQTERAAEKPRLGLVPELTRNWNWNWRDPVAFRVN